MKFKLLAGILFITGSVLLWNGCKKKDDDPTPFTNADYAGTWTVTDGCCTGSFQITITATGSDGVSITNFRKCSAAAGWNITGTVADGKLTIPAQNVVSSTQGGPYKFSGTGSISSATSLSIPYTMADGNGNFPQSCTATCTK